MRKISCWIYCVFVLNCLEAAEEIPLTRLIEAYYEAGDYDEALDLLEKLRAENLPAWQKVRIMYNIGTILMHKGLWEEASSVFASIPLSFHSLPILRPAIRNNLAVLNYMKALNVMEKKELTLNEYNHALYLLENAQREAKDAQEAVCAFYQMEDCSLQKDQIELLAAIKNKREELLKAKEEIKTAQKDKIPFKDEEISPKDILEAGIQEQLQALSLSRIAEMKGEKQFNAQLAQAQSNVLEAIDSFMQVVLDTEKKDYLLRCQRMPWEKVLPLFNQGKQSAVEAKSKLTHFSTLLQAIRLQEQTIQFWQEALTAIQKPLTEEDLYCENQKGKGESASSPVQQSEGSTTQDVLRLLLLMDQDDQQLQPESVEPRKGTKPW